MSWRRVRAVCIAQLLELSRRRTAVALLFILPLLFYWMSAKETSAIVYATVGMGWSASVVTLFLSLGMRAITPRMGLIGFGVADQIVGRILSMLIFGSPVAGCLWLYLSIDDVVVNRTYLALSLGSSLVCSLAAGLAAGALIPREMEAMLVLIALVGLTFVVDYQAKASKALPLYAAEQYAVASSTGVSSGRPWLVSALVTFGLVTLSVGVRRLSIGRHHL